MTGFLRPAEKQGAVDIWTDRLMPGGADWSPEIERKLRNCDIFVLLISRNSLSSDYVVDKEIAAIRERQTNGKDVHFYPLLLTPTPAIGARHCTATRTAGRAGRDRFSTIRLTNRYQPYVGRRDEIVEIAEDDRRPQKRAGAAARPDSTAARVRRLIDADAAARRPSSPPPCRPTQK